ncbi:MAG TPA: hypothetical protein VLJ59_16000 [Mycobacteriales bacterium]|nr:hypothetical protein [Mycobacteriales bacterium]
MLGEAKLAKLKVASGEHLAAMLTAAFLGAAPVSVDGAGEADLVFDLTRREYDGPVGADLVGRDADPWLTGWSAGSGRTLLSPSCPCPSV